MIARRSDPHGQLASALVAIAGARIVESRETAWASATFTGARHRFILDLPAEQDPAPYTRLYSHEFTLAGHIVADIGLSQQDQDSATRRLTIDALTVEDA